MHGKIAPSIMCADLFTLQETLRSMEKFEIEYLHMDVMDGEFVQNFCLGADYIKRIRKESKIPLDIHLMIEKPELKLEWFDIQQGEIVSIHYETTNHLQRAIDFIKGKKARVFLAINPATPSAVVEELIDEIDGVLVMTVNPGFAGQIMVPHTLKKIKRIRGLFEEYGYPQKEIEVDGNVSFENAKKMREVGADIFVAGTASIFGKEIAMEEAIKMLREVIQ